MNRRSIFVGLVIGFSVLSSRADSILDVKHSITNDNVVAPESFETKTRELEENFYLKNYIDNTYKEGAAQTGSEEEYEANLKRLPVQVEMPYNSIVGKFINMYLGKRRRLVSDMLALHSYYGPMFKDALAREGVPQELEYLPVIESAINPNAVSRAGATGLWQFMASTGTGLGLEVNSLVDQRRDPELSTRQAVRYLKQLYDIYEDWSLAIAAYNCGPGRVNQALRRAGGGKKDFWEIYYYLPAETRDYIPAFIAANYVMNYHDKYGIQPTVVKRPLVTDKVEVADRIHFKQIAEVLNIPIEELRMLNPQYLKDIIPGDFHPYWLVLPKQQCLSYIMSEDKIKEYNAEEFAQRTRVEPGESKYQPAASDVAAAEGDVANVAPESAVTGKVVRKTHVVTRGENIRDIAKKYNVSATDIKHWNHLRRGKVKEGDELIIEVIERDLAQNEVSQSKREESQDSVVPMPKERKQSTATNDEGGRRRYSTGGTSTSSQGSRYQQDDDRWRTSSTSKNKSSKKATAAKPTTHTVAKGESLEKIARKAGVSVDELRKANGMKNGESMIREGQKLKVPGKTGVSGTSGNKKSKSSARKGNSKKSSTSAKKSSAKKKRR